MHNGVKVLARGSQGQQGGVRQEAKDVDKGDRREVQQSKHFFMFAHSSGIITRVCGVCFITYSTSL